GSYLDDKVLRFDFSHFSKVSPEELERIEDLVNEKIRLDIILDEKRNVPIQEALQAGATATFGEKYGDYVRVITFEPGFSTELCGGTHVTSTGQIGLFKFLSEGSVSAGIRRVEAVAGEGALSYIRQQEQTLAALKELLRHPKDLIKQTQSLLEERTTLAKKVEALQNEKIQLLKKQLIERAEDNKSFKLIVSKVDVPNPDGLKKLSYDLKDEIPNLIAVLGAEIEGKPFLSVYIAEDLVKEAGLHAGQIVKELAKEIRGGGGGQPFFATAGGSDPSGLDRALSKGRKSF
ncbi:MAG: DHHA1 domain-containing protein, partial [Spirosomataceae bacterium]